MKSFEKIENERINFPAAENSAYFESAATGLVPKYVFDAVNHYQQMRHIAGGDSRWGEQGQDSIQMMETSRKKLSAMMNCDAEDISFAMNTSHALSFFSSNLEFKRGSNVVIPQNSYNSGKFMWQIRESEGLEIRYAKTEDGQVLPESIIDLIDENTVAVHCSYVESSTGFRIDAKKIGEYCRARNICFVLDATQALGVLRVDVQELCVDVVAGNDYKWMMNYGGVGYVYIRKEIREKLKQRCAGWMSDVHRFYEEPDCLTLRKDGARFELGYPNMSGICGIGLVADRYAQIGGKQIEEYIFSLCDYLKERVKETDGVSLKYDFSEKNRSQILYLRVNEKIEISKEKLQSRGVMCDVRGKESDGKTIIRIAVHYYNNRSDIDKLIAAIITCSQCEIDKNHH